MKSDNEIKADAYKHAQEDACNKWCDNFKLGACPCAPDKKTNCFRFNMMYLEWIDELKIKACQDEFNFDNCGECADYHMCNLLKY